MTEISDSLMPHCFSLANTFSLFPGGRRSPERRNVAMLSHVPSRPRDNTFHTTVGNSNSLLHVVNKKIYASWIRAFRGTSYEICIHAISDCALRG